MNPADHSILIVDDEEALRESIAFDFRRKKFNVHTAACGRDALKIVEKHKIDVVLSDVRMANGTGLELLDWIKERDVFLPVLMFVTAYVDISIAEAYDRGADAIFAKPFDRTALYDAVVRAIESLDQRLRRSGTRVEANVSVKVKFLKNDLVVDARGMNMGRGGLFLAFDGPLPAVGENTEFHLTHEDDIPIIGKGVVRWVRTVPGAEGPAGCGIEFLALEGNARSEFLKMLNFIKTKSYIPLK